MFTLSCLKEDYWQPAFVVPLLSMAFCLLILLISLWRLFLSFRDSEPLSKPICKAVFCFMTLACLCSIHYPTFRHGIFLPMVTEDDVQYMQGYVTAIEEVPFSPRYSISDESQTYRASFVKIGDEMFYFLHAAGLEIGQKVGISFLPKCEMVLTCQVIEN